MDGTLRSRFTENDGRGRVFAKTGSLNPVVSLSGEIYNRHHSNTTLFSFQRNDLACTTNAQATVKRAVPLITANLAGPRRKNAMDQAMAPTVYLEGTAPALAWDDWEPSPQISNKPRFNAILMIPKSIRV